MKPFEILIFLLLFVVGIFSSTNTLDKIDGDGKHDDVRESGGADDETAAWIIDDDDSHLSLSPKGLTATPPPPKRMRRQAAKWTWNPEQWLGGGGGSSAGEAERRAKAAALSAEKRRTQKAAEGRSRMVGLFLYSILFWTWFGDIVANLRNYPTIDVLLIHCCFSLLTFVLRRLFGIILPPADLLSSSSSSSEGSATPMTLSPTTTTDGDKALVDGAVFLCNLRTSRSKPETVVCSGMQP